MPHKEPRWWYGQGYGDERMRRMLAPVARIYGFVSERRLVRKPEHHSNLPIICAGNFTAGGTGKTPLAQLLAAELMHLGEAPAVLTRGYRGRNHGPHWVTTETDTAIDVGDEPLLLAQTNRVLVARDRTQGCKAIERTKPPATAIIMDDGLQNPLVFKDLRIALVDGRRGVGNGEVIPAGPLRAPLETQLSHADCILVNRGAENWQSETEIEKHLKRFFTGPVLSAAMVPAGDVAWLKGTDVYAYAGIVNPKRFFGLLKSLGANVIETRQFPDHHPFTAHDAETLLRAARGSGATLVTTEKDAVRLSAAEGPLAELKEKSRTLPVRMILDERNLDRLRSLIVGALKLARERIAAGPHA